MTSNELENDCHQLQIQPLFEYWVDLSAAVENENEQDEEDNEANENVVHSCSSSSKNTLLSTLGNPTTMTTHRKILANKFEYSDSIENLSIINSLINNQLQNLQNNNNNNNTPSAATTSQVYLKMSPAMHNIAIPDLSLIPNTDLRLLRIDSKKLEKTLSSSSSTKFQGSAHLQSSRSLLDDLEDVGGNGENINDNNNSSDSDSVGKDSHKKDTLSLCSSASSHDISNCGSDEGSFHGNVIPATSSIGNCRKKFRSSSVQCSKRCDSQIHKDQKGRGNYVTTTKMTHVKRNFRR